MTGKRHSIGPNRGGQNALPCSSRRTFLVSALSALAAPAVLSGRTLGYDGGVAPSERIVAAMIGLGNRGNELLGGFTGEPEYQVVGVCDCWESKAQLAKERLDCRYGNTDGLIFPKYEEVLIRDDLDLIIIATPDHWHSKLIVESCRAGKDVYCEKPLTLTLAENRLVVKAARKYNRVVSSGSQRVMEDYGYMAPVAQSGRFGEIREMFVNVGKPALNCYLPAEKVPEGFDWDRWLGQAPEAPYNAERCSGSYGGGWRNYYEYGNGFLADWGAHKFGGALYAVGLDGEEPVQVLQPNSGENQTPYMTLVYRSGAQLHHVVGSEHDITLVGDGGEYRLGQTEIKPLKPVDVRRYKGGATRLIGDCAYSYKNRLRPFQDVLYGSCVAAACQMMNLGYQLRRDLTWDAQRCVFIGDEQATRMVHRVQRAPYTIEG